MMDVSIIIVNYNTVDYLRECLHSITQFTPQKPEIIVVDNASSDGSCDMVRNEFPEVVLIESTTNLGFGLGNNAGVALATKSTVMLFNSDAILKMDTATILQQYLNNHPEVSCICPRVVLPVTQTIQPKTFGFVPTLKNLAMQSLGLNKVFPKTKYFSGIDGDYRWAKEMEVGWVSGVCMMMRKQDYLSVGGFDQRFFMYCEDIELCMKLAKVGKIILYDDAEIIHYGGASSKTMASKVRNGLWQQRHLLIIVSDYFGAIHAFLARIILFVGLCLRLFAALFSIPKNGIHDNENLQIAWAKFKDLLGLNTIQKGNSACVSE